MATMSESEFQSACNRLVGNEVQSCISSLVSEIAKGVGCDAVADLAELALELCRPVEDWEGAAIQEGWSRNEVTGFFSGPVVSGVRIADYDSWQELCEDNNIDPYEWEVYEHWIVSPWLAEKLAEKGERIEPDFFGLAVWGRTTTGQGIAMDGVIRDIVKELHSVSLRAP